MNKLRPCPFCGGQPEVNDYFISGSANHLNYFARCPFCEIRLRSRKNDGGAIDDWNHRPIEDAQSALIEMLGDMLNKAGAYMFDDASQELINSVKDVLKEYREWKDKQHVT